MGPSGSAPASTRPRPGAGTRSAPPASSAASTRDRPAVDTRWFVNDLQGGAFSLGARARRRCDGTTYQTLDLVFTPAEYAGPVAGFGNALACGSGYLNAPNSDAVSFSGASEYTIEMWVRPHAGATDNTTLMRQRDGGPGTEETWFAITKDRMLFCGIQNYAEPGLAVPRVRPRVAARQVVARGDGEDDGRAAAVRRRRGRRHAGVGWPFNAGAPSKAPLTFGGDDLEGNHVPGDLDEIMVYDRALSAAQLAAVYNRGPGQGLAAGVADPVRVLPARRDRRARPRPMPARTASMRRWSTWAPHPGSPRPPAARPRAGTVRRAWSRWPTAASARPTSRSTSCSSPSTGLWTSPPPRADRVRTRRAPAGWAPRRSRTP